MQVNWPEGYKLARKKSLAVNVACLAIILTYPACLLWMKTQTTAEAMPPLFCRTHASHHSFTCRTKGKVVSPMWPSCWTQYRCHEPGSSHTSTVAKKDSRQWRPASLKGSKRRTISQDSGIVDWSRPSCDNIDEFEICITDDLETNQLHCQLIVKSK